MMGSTASWASMAAITRHFTGEIHTFEIIFFRSFFGTVFLLPWLFRLGFAGLRTQRIGMHIARGFAGLATIYMLFTAIDEIARHTAHTELILALERRGSPDPGRLDRDWMRVVADACDRAGVHLRSVLISHTRGVREHAPPESTLVEA